MPRTTSSSGPPSATWRPLPNSGIATVGEFGPSALVVADSFEVQGDDLVVAPVFARFSGSHDVSQPNLYIRDAAWSGPPLGDLDGDEDVDADDVDLIGLALRDHGPLIVRDATGWQFELDLNRDGRIDDVDRLILEAVVDVQAGRIEPVPAAPFPTMPPDLPE